MLAHIQFSLLNLHKDQVVNSETWSCLLTALCQPYIWILLLVFKIQQREMSENSQNHSMVEVEGDLCRSDPTALFKLGYLEQAAKDCVQMASKYLQAWISHNILGQSVPVLTVDPKSTSSTTVEIEIYDGVEAD